MLDARGDGYGGHRSSKSTSGAAILAAFIPTFAVACVYVVIFLAVRNSYRKIYAPRTFLGTVHEKDQTPEIRPDGTKWFKDFRSLSDRFVLQHNSLDAYLFLRFFKFIIIVCFLGCLLTWPVLFPVNITAGGDAGQLDRLTFSNVKHNDYLWAHTVIAYVFFGLVFTLIAAERLQLIGIRKAHFLNEPYNTRLSARTVLFMNAPREALLPENLGKFFGKHAQHSWPVKDAGDLEDLLEARKAAAFDLESAEMDLIVTSVKRAKKSADAHHSSNDVENGVDGVSTGVPKGQRPVKRNPPLVGPEEDKIHSHRNAVLDLTSKIDAHRLAPSRSFPEQSAVFVSFPDQGAAHRAFQQVKFRLPVSPLEDRYLAIQPKEVLWRNLAMPLSMRVSKSSIALVFVIVFTIFFSIPVGILGTISNVNYLAENVEFLAFIKDLPPAVLGLLTGLLPPALISWFVSYVPKLFRNIAKLSGEPTTPQAELLTQAWFFVFQVIQVFLVTTFSSGAAAVASQIAQDPSSAPDLLASSLPKASNFYLTYFILQGTTSAADNLLNYSDLLEYLFYIKFWDKTPRQKFQHYSQMKGMNWGKWYPKFTNLFVIAIVYSCIAPLVLGFATVGFCVFYLAYRYNCIYVYQTKIDTRGESYKRSLQQMMTGIYLAELCLIGLFSARQATAQTALMILLLVATALGNFILDRVLRPLEVLLGVDVWTEMEVPLLAEEDGISPDDDAALHVASHNRRLGLNRLPRPIADVLSLFFDGIISASESKTRTWLTEPSARQDGAEDQPELSEEEVRGAYVNPAFTAKTPKLWIPRDPTGAVSKEEIRENEEVGIQCTDESASVDEKGSLLWERDFQKVPIWKAPKVI